MRPAREIDPDDLKEIKGVVIMEDEARDFGIYTAQRCGYNV
ncbi:MAG: hypothetical protein R2865_04145 [Deinococcales bacterium]